MLLKYICCALALLALDVSLRAQAIDDYSAKIDSLIETSTPRNFNGVILITKGEEIKYKKAFGYANFDRKIPLNTDNNFIIMSNSKQITAVLILKEVEKGKINLHSPIRKYLPDLPKSWADTVTVHHLLNFTSGITEVDKPLNFKPGTDFLYGNTAYVLLGQILEKVTRKKYISLANSLFKSLKMRNTFCFEKGLIQHRVAAHRNKNNILTIETQPLLDNKSVPAAGIISNLADLHIWDKALHKGQLLRPETYKLMTSYSITAQHNAFGKDKIGYGYGIRINDSAPIKYIGHTGGGGGFLSLKIYFPDADVNLIVLENQSPEDMDIFYDTEIKIKDIILGSSLMKR